MQGLKLTPTEKADFIKKLRLTGGNVSKACQVIKISRSTAYDHKENDADFSALWDEAINAGADDLEEELRRRAYKGTRKPVYQGGKLVGYIREYSDSLGMFILKRRKPEYREHSSLDITASVREMSDEELSVLARGDSN